MAFWCLVGAALVSLVGALVHGVAGHNLYIGQVSSSSLEPISQSLSLASWHMATIFFAVGAAACTWVALNPADSKLLIPLIAMNLLGAGLFVALGLGGHADLLQLPGAYLMGATALLAVPAVYRVG